MARRARVEYPGAFYHVITRGNQRQRIFRDDRDRKKYLEILSSLKNQFSFRIRAYVLMQNHVHLLVESGEVPLSRIMQRLEIGVRRDICYSYVDVIHRAPWHGERAWSIRGLFITSLPGAISANGYFAMIGTAKSI
jgi:REP element-mobilizing transposase RayT